MKVKGSMVPPACLRTRSTPPGLSPLPKVGIFENIEGDSHFDEDEDWADSGSPTDGFDFITVAAHELGHALGIDHSNIEDALMFPFYGGPRR
jgi:hypothetical protein